MLQSRTTVTYYEKAQTKMAMCASKGSIYNNKIKVGALSALPSS